MTRWQIRGGLTGFKGKHMKKDKSFSNLSAQRSTLSRLSVSRKIRLLP